MGVVECGDVFFCLFIYLFIYLFQVELNIF